jgi:hypothetical protein
MERFELKIAKVTKSSDGKFMVAINVSLNGQFIGTGEIELNELNTEVSKKVTEQITESHYNLTKDLAEKLVS